MRISTTRDLDLAYVTDRDDVSILTSDTDQDSDT
jgi:hypothetical protein